MAKTAGTKILLGCGVFTIGTTPIGLTRGGGSFVVERDVRNIEADCDRGPIKGRIVIDSEVAKLTMNALEIFEATEIADYYPNLTVTPTPASEATSDVITSSNNPIIDDADYSAVKWVGKTKDGFAVTIELTSAINLENIDWDIQPKDETVASLTYTAVYTESDRTTPPWKVTLGKTKAALPAGEMTVTLKLGTALNTTATNSITPAKGASNSYLYKTNGDLPATGDILVSGTDGWIAYTAAADIVVSAGTVLTFAEIVTATGAVVNAGSVNVLTGNINLT